MPSKFPSNYATIVTSNYDAIYEIRGTIKSFTVVMGLLSLQVVELSDVYGGAI